MSRTKVEQAKRYKTLLIEARGLREQSGSNAYRRAKLLVDVFNDPDFRADFQQFDDESLANELDQYVDDLALDFLQLRALLDRFPSEREWSEGKLHRMYQSLIEEKRQARAKARGDANADSVAMQQPTKKELRERMESAEKRAERAEIRIGDASLRADTAERQLEAARAEILALKAKIERLEGRIEELTKRRLQVA